MIYAAIDCVQFHKNFNDSEFSFAKAKNINFSLRTISCQAIKKGHVNWYYDGAFPKHYFVCSCPFALCFHNIATQ